MEKSGYEKVNLWENVQQSIHFGLNKFEGFNMHDSMEKSWNSMGKLTARGISAHLRGLAGRISKNKLVNCEAMVARCHPGGQYGR